MSPDEMKGILARHVMASESDCVDQAQEDRGALLDLLRRLAQAGVAAEYTSRGQCDFCGAALWDESSHEDDCPAPLLEVLR